MLIFNVVNAQITNNLVSDGTFTGAAPAASNPYGIGGPANTFSNHFCTNTITSYNPLWSAFNGSPDVLTVGNGPSSGTDDVGRQWCQFANTTISDESIYTTLNTSACGLNTYTFAPGQIYNFHFSYSASRHLNFVTNGVSNFDPDVNTAGLSVWLTANSAAGANCGTSANSFAQIAPLTTDVMVFQNLNIPYITQFNGGNQNNGLPLLWLPADVTFTYNGIPGQDQIRWLNNCTPNSNPNITGESVDINIDDVEITCNTILDVVFSQNFPNNDLTSVFSDITQASNGVTICQWNWDFGDGTTSNLQNPSHDYINAGNYQVCLDVIDSRGCTGRSCIIICAHDICGCSGFKDINASIDISGSNTYDQHLVVKPGVVLTFNNANALFKRGCKILVERNARLNIINSILDDAECNGEGKTWGGIQVWGTQSAPHPAKLDITSSMSFLNLDQGIVYSNGSTIRDVANVELDGAINAGPNPPFTPTYMPNWQTAWETYFGGVIVVDNSAIINCRVGIKMQRYPAAGQFNQSINKILNTQFTNVKNGIINSWVNGLSIESCNFLWTVTPKQATGVTVLNGRTIIIKSKFQNYQLGVNAFAIGESNMYTEIGQASNPLSGNTFTNCRQDIHLSGLSRADVFYNAFNNPQSSTPPTTGVWLDGPNTYDIEQNNFNGHETGVLAQNAFVNGGVYASLKCNKYNNYLVGIGAVGDNKSLLFDNESFNTGLIGLAYGLYNVPGLNFHNLPPQGIDGGAVWNYFNLSNTDIASPSPSVGNTEQFWYYYPEIASQTDLALRPLCAVNNNNCQNTANFFETPTDGGGNHCGGNEPPRCLTEACLNQFNSTRLGIQVLLDTGDDQNLFHSVATYISDVNVVLAINAASPYLSDRVLIALCENNNFSDIYQLSVLQQHARLSNLVMRAATLNLPPAMTVQLNGINQQNQRSVKLGELNRIDQLRWSAINAIIEPYRNNVGYSTLQSLLTAQPDVDASLLALYGVQVSLGKWTDAQSTINIMRNQTADLKKLLRTEVDLMSQTKPALTFKQKTLIANNEAKGTIEGSTARRLGTWFQDKMYFAPDFNFAPSSLIDNSDSEQAKQENLFSLSPNPAEDVVNIEVIEDTQEMFNCMVTDINGRVMYSGKLSNKAIIPTFEWVSGVYFVRLQSNTKISVKQLIINR